MDHQRLPCVYLTRHGETLWSKSGQHTSHTDIDLTENGTKQVQKLSFYVFENDCQDYVQHSMISKIIVSPMKRAKETLAQLKFPQNQTFITEESADVREWEYGDYEGLTSQEIHKTNPEWNIFEHGCPNGETADQVGERAKRVAGRIRAYHAQCRLEGKVNADVMIVAHSHFLRVFAQAWRGLPPQNGMYHILDTASLSMLGYEHNLDEPVVRCWNVTSHLWSRG